MANSAQTVGSLLVDLRANTATFKADMDEATSQVTKSSRQMSSEMKTQITDTRQSLALMRDDFGIGIPRELRKSIASVGVLRDTISALGPVLFGLAFANIAVEAFKKIEASFDETTKKAEEEAKYTRDIAEAAMRAVEATVKRSQELGLIGKGEEERAALQKKFFDDEISRAKLRIAALQTEIAAKVALMNVDLDAVSTDPFQTMGDENDRNLEAADARNASLKEILKTTEAVRKQIEEFNKEIQEAQKGQAQSADTLNVYLQGQALARLKNEQEVAASEIALAKDKADKSLAVSLSGIEAEQIALRTAATEKYNLDVETLQKSIAILQKDPGRNKEMIASDQAKLLVLYNQYQGQLFDIAAKGIQARASLIAEENRLEADALKGVAELTRKNGTDGAFLSGIGAGVPQLKATLAGFKQSLEVNFNSPLKDAQTQSKLLESAMEGLLTPTAKFEVLQAELAPLMERYKDQPDVIKAITRELNLANPEFQKLKDVSTEFGHDLATELDNVIAKGESMHDMLVNILKDIGELILKATLLAPLEQFFSGGGTGTGGFVGMLGHLFGFADGGRPAAGQLSIVGENGPELFMPDSAGTVIPNNQLGGGGRNTTIYVDARGADAGVEARVHRAIQAAMAQSVQSSLAAAVELSRRR